MSLKACIYDLDRIITDTGKYEYEAWKWVASELGLQLNSRQNQKLKDNEGKEALEKILKWAAVRISEAEKQQLLLDKNRIFLDFIDAMQPHEVFEGFTQFNQDLRNQGIKAALAASGKNAIRIIDKLDLVMDFDVIVDAGMLNQNTPFAEVLILAGNKLQLPASECVAIKATQEGITTARKTGMKTVAFGNNRELKGSLLHVEDWRKASLKDIHDLFN